jgi:ketosteroid isomerase-like protein
MTGEEAIGVIERGYQALERRDLDTFIATWEEASHPDIEFISAIGSAVEGGSFKGPAGVRTWFTNLFETTDEVHWRDRTYEALGDVGVLVLLHFEMRGAASGVELSSDIGNVFELEDGLFKRGTSYTSHGDARAAAEKLKERADA